MPDVPFLPPGPSPEFLKRQAVMGLPQDPAFTGSFDPIRGNAFAGSFDPSTGVRQGMTVNAPVTPPATSEMQMLEAIRQQVNAMHFKNAQDALNASIQFQHMREAQRMRERGATEEQIMSRLGRGLFYQNNNPYAQARAVSELSPAPEPRLIDVGGNKAWVATKDKRVTPVRPPSKGQVIETGVDANGKPYTKVSFGGESSTGLTTATQGQIQQRLLGFEKSIGTAAELYSRLTPEMLGVKGLFGDIVVDRGLAQFAPELANKQRINGRTLLRVFNEQIIKTLKVDAQVNRDEEKRLLAALPEPGAVSSLPDAQEKIQTFMGLIRDQARVDAKAEGRPLPEWALSLADLAKMVKSNQMDKAAALALMKRYGIRK